MQTEVQLKVDDIDYGGWTSMRITRSIESISGSFELTVSDNWSGENITRPIKKGALCQLLIDGEQVIGGAVDDRSVSYGKESHDITISGRDATGDLVDCSAIETDLKGSNLLEIATKLCKPFGIKVRAETDVGKPFGKSNIAPGQTVFEVLSMLAADCGVLLVSDALGNLIITKASDKPSGGSIVFGKNVLTCSANDSMRDLYSKITVKNQGPQNDSDSGKRPTQSEYVSEDASFGKRHRPLTILAENGADLKKTADFERNVRAGRARSVVYTVTGWGPDEMSLWQPNTIVSVTDPNLEPPLDHTPLLISSVSYIRDEQGTHSELTVMKRSAFDVLLTPEKDGDAA